MSNVRESTSRRNAKRTIRDYRDATGCSRLWATIHWALVCCIIVTQTSREQAPLDPKSTIELTNFVVELEAREARLSGTER